MDPAFAVSPFLAQRTVWEVYRNLLEMLWGVDHMVSVARPWEQPEPGHLD